MRHARDTHAYHYMLGKVRDMIQQWFANRREATLQIRVLRNKVQFKKDVDSYIVDFDAQTFTCDEF